MEALEVLLTDRAQTVTTAHQAFAAQRAPEDAAECCIFLQTLACNAATGNQVQYEWCWSLDDARFPSFEEQRYAQLLNQAVPKMILGRWPSGFLRFLAETLRSVWSRPLFAPAPNVVVPGWLRLSLCKRRRCTSSPIIAISDATAKKVFSQLCPVINFVAQGLSRSAEDQVPLGTPCSAVTRSQLYVKRTEAHEYDASSARSRVREAMLEVLDVADRTRQVLGLMKILHTSHRTQAVLESAQLQEHEPAAAARGALESVVLPTAASMLVNRSLRDLVLSPQSLWPAVQLCTALVQAVQGEQDGQGLPGSGFSALRGCPHESEVDHICKELQDCCPAIFSQVDLKRCVRDADGQPRSMETRSVLRRYADSLPSATTSLEWHLLCRGIRALASEAPAMAAELCAERVCKLSSRVDEECCRGLISSLLDAMSLENPEAAAEALESFLRRTRAVNHWNAVCDTEPVSHHIVFDHLLSVPRLHGLLEAILSTDATNIKALLQRRSANSRVASELLLRYFHQRRGHERHERPVWAQLQRLVEAPEQFYSLKDRIRYLHLAQEQRKNASSASLQDELALRLRAAEKLQLPLLQELLDIAGNEDLDTRWREAAHKRCAELQQLRSARELYEVAGEFGLWHLQLGIAGFSGVKMAHDVATTLWAGLLFPPPDGPYSSHSDEVDAAATPKLLFPLLLRPRQLLLEKQDQAEPLKPSLLRDRVLSFLQELREVAPASHQLWHVRGIATLLEFSSCLWLNALQKLKMDEAEPSESGADGAAGSPLIDESRLWVALEVLMQKPFSFSLPDLVTFYADMIAQLDAWHADLQETSAYSRARKWAWPGQEDVHLHLSHVAIVLLASWLREAERACDSISETRAEAESDFVRVWRRSADGLLSGLCLRLNHTRHLSARRLLGEALRLEKSCRMLLDRVVYLGPETHFAGEVQRAM
ncbi:Sec61b [Symbiodinium natans]|uniref:Sec61b protein n=1 Tax=Symbiodinium natans TaxID=878477 RepID=A0A812V1A5_9DINO|nr:Sec61b [Symbiodinium natans]